jgi:hypothetical protein
MLVLRLYGFHAWGTAGAPAPTPIRRRLLTLHVGR